MNRKISIGANKKIGHVSSVTYTLIHCQRLAQIPREIGVEALQDAHVVGEQLQRQNRQQRHGFGRGIRDGDHVAVLSLKRWWAA